MRTTASYDGKTVTTESVNALKQSGRLRVPYRDLDTLESIALGFQQDMFEITEGGKSLGGVSTGSGWGTDSIVLQWGDQKVLIRGRDLLKVWVRTIDPDDAKRLP